MISTSGCDLRYFSLSILVLIWEWKYIFYSNCMQKWNFCMQIQLCLALGVTTLNCRSFSCCSDVNTQVSVSICWKFLNRSQKSARLQRHKALSLYSRLQSWPVMQMCFLLAWATLIKIAFSITSTHIKTIETHVCSSLGPGTDLVPLPLWHVRLDAALNQSCFDPWSLDDQKSQLIPQPAVWYRILRKARYGGWGGGKVGTECLSQKQFSKQEAFRIKALIVNVHQYSGLRYTNCTRNLIFI